MVCAAAGTFAFCAAACGFGVTCFAMLFAAGGMLARLFFGAGFRYVDFAGFTLAGGFASVFSGAFAAVIAAIGFAGSLSCLTSAADFTPAAIALLTAERESAGCFIAPPKSGLTITCRSYLRSTDSSLSN